MMAYGTSGLALPSYERWTMLMLISLSLARQPINPNRKMGLTKIRVKLPVSITHVILAIWHPMPPPGKAHSKSHDPKVRRWLDNDGLDVLLGAMLLGTCLSLLRRDHPRVD